MKIKIWQFEYDFDKDDAKIVMPFALVALAIAFSKKNSIIFISLGSIYYLVYFFSNKLSDLIKKIKFRCPKCKSRKLILQGYQTHHSDELHAFYLCTDCKTTSIQTEGGLTA